MQFAAYSNPFVMGGRERYNLATWFTTHVLFEVQIVRKKLPLEAHDQLLDALVTERRRLDFGHPHSG
jgi:hypothetical protein